MLPTAPPSPEAPHSPSAAGHVDPEPLPPFPHRSRASVVALILALLPVVAWGACATEILDANGDDGALAWLTSVVLALCGAVLGLVVFFRLRARPEELRPQGARMGLTAFFVGLLSPVVTFFLGLVLVDFNFTRGRRLVRRRVSRLAPAVAHSGWLNDERDDDDAIDAPAAAAAAWRENAATEHASVAAFSSLSLELCALGAPASLVQAAHEDALDEIRHARLCYDVARRIDGQTLGAGPLPWATAPLDEAPSCARLAADAAVEACLLEGASARLLSQLARRDDVVPAVRRVLRALAQDEGKHAAHGYDLIDWARAQDPRGVDDAIAARLGAMPASVPAPAREHGADGVDLERFGIASAAHWQRCYQETLRDVRARLLPAHRSVDGHVDSDVDSVRRAA